MSFLSGFYNRLSGTFARPSEGENGDITTSHLAQSDSANENDASSRTLSPEDDQGDVETPEKAPITSRSRVPPTPSFAPPATPFAGQASPVVNQAAAEQLMREAESYATTPALRNAPTPFFGIFAPPQTPAARNLSPVRAQAAEQQLMREMLGDVPETPATVQTRARATPMTLYKTPAMSQSTPEEPSTEQSIQTDAFQTPSVMPSKRQRRNHSPIQEESEIIFADVKAVDTQSQSSSTSSIDAEEEEEEQEEEAAEQEAPSSSPSATSSPKAPIDMDLSSADENDTSTTSIESSDDSDKKRRITTISTTTKTRRNQRSSRPNQRMTSKSYEDNGRTRVQKSTRPGVSRSVSGREELLNRARKRYHDRKADGLF
ncbi:hypothetical protein D6D01_05226 [Aureobasidium pullulans]|uniref:Uncharacterized protein n=1 Tax=Aureobasidium pullulans TaxID=5580 RepID=A0A4S9L7A2_AURPU|nr:hypothetical protein D6D01_05226 [Aureobasidium pullulans]